MRKINLVFALLLILSSCSFNKMFLKPTNLQEVSTTKINIGGQPIDLHFTPDTFQPTFMKGSDTVSFNFSIRSVVFKSTSSNTLNAWLLQPEDIPAPITLLFFHGNGGFLGSQFQGMAPLVKFGFQILMVDYSGYGLSTGKASRKNVLLDALSTIDYALQNSEIKNTSVVIYGQSLGGNVAAVAAAERQDKINGLVLEGAFTSHDDMAAKQAGFFGRMMVAEKYSAKESIQLYGKPVLIIHSTEDKTVPFEMGKELFDLANQPKQFYQIDKCHICGPTFYAPEIAERIKKMVL